MEPKDQNLATEMKRFSPIRKLKPTMLKYNNLAQMMLKGYITSSQLTKLRDTVRLNSHSGSSPIKTSFPAKPTNKQGGEGLSLFSLKEIEWRCSGLELKQIFNLLRYSLGYISIRIPKSIRIYRKSFFCIISYIFCN